MKIDSFVSTIKLSQLKLKFTFSPGKSSKKADSIEYYYTNETGLLTKFENENIVHAKFGKLNYLSKSSFYFKNEKLIKVEILRRFPDTTKSFSVFYISPTIKYSKNEKKMYLNLTEKANSVIKVFHDSIQ